MLIVPTACSVPSKGPGGTLFSRGLSIYGLIAELALVEKRVAFEVIDVDPTSSEHRQRHPFGKIPVLDDCRGARPVRIYESLAVTRYINEAFEGPALEPADAVGRALMMQWIQAVNCYFFPTWTQGITKPRLFDTDRPADEAAISCAVAAAAVQLDLVEAALGAAPWLAGEQLTLADLFLFPNLAGLMFTPEGQDLLASHPICQFWISTMEARESVRITGLSARN